MSQNTFDDLEEGEIADDDVEPTIEKKVKRLPRRYVVNDNCIASKHRKNCKHASQQHKQKSNDHFHKQFSFHKKHRKMCPKHNYRRHSNLLGDESLNLSLKNQKYKNYSKTPLLKSAFKNYMSPPRKVVKISSEYKSLSESVDMFPKLLSDYKKSRNEINKSITSSNLKEGVKPPNLSNEKNILSKPAIKQNFIPIECINISSDDEDEEELRRLALATCLKRQSENQNIIKTEKSCKASTSAPELQPFDNYEIIDMEVGNSDSENLEAENLFVIDTTPSYFCELSQPSLDSINSNNYIDNLNPNLQSGAFLPNLSIEEPFQNFSNDTYCQEVNNDLYSNFELVNENSPLPSSQLDDDFEEDLLRAQLIANMNSIRQKNQANGLKKEVLQEVTPIENCRNESILNENRTTYVKPENQNGNLSSKSKLINREVFKDGRVVSIRSNTNENNLNDNVINISKDDSNNEASFKEERTVSIISNMPKRDAIFNDRSRSVTAIYPKRDFPNSSSSNRKNVDIKVKVNNVLPSNSLPSNKVLLPQERLIISLNNESSSDDSDQEDKSPKNNSNKNFAVASLEALISTARQESDVKKDVVTNLETSTNSNNSTDAVSWLSKAQQEEYNSLKKILDSKMQNPISQNKVIPPTESNELNLLKRKLLIAKKNLEKEKIVMSSTMKELLKKKRAYMLSKLKTQQLKEQLLAAERVRKTNLQLWTKCSSNLQTLKKSVAKREAIIDTLQTKLNSFFPDYCSNVSPPFSSHALDHNYNISL